MVLCKTEWIKGENSLQFFFTIFLQTNPCRITGVFYIHADGSK